MPILLRVLGISQGDFLALPKAILVWPAAAAVLGLVLLLRFREAIDHVIRHGRFKLPGGVEIQSQAPPSEEAPAGPGAVTLTPEQQEELSRFVQSLQQQSNLASAQSQQATELFR